LVPLIGEGVLSLDVIGDSKGRGDSNVSVALGWHAYSAIDTRPNSTLNHSNLTG
jgi:hypothetical protein